MRPDASRVIWDWRREQSAQARREARRRARLAGAVQGVVAAGVGATLLLFGLVLLGWLGLALGALTAAAALLSPERLYASIRRLTSSLGIRIGRTVSWLLLAPLFYLFFAPFGLLFRRRQRDPLERCFEPDLPTYWKRRASPEPSPSGYERLF
jgi:hypothetical protein